MEAFNDNYAEKQLRPGGRAFALIVYQFSRQVGRRTGLRFLCIRLGQVKPRSINLFAAVGQLSACFGSKSNTISRRDINFHKGSLRWLRWKSHYMDSINDNSLMVTSHLEVKLMTENACEYLVGIVLLTVERRDIFAYRP